MTTPILNTLEMERYIAASAKRADLNVQWVDDGMASTDGKTMRLPRIKAGITENDYRKLRHFVTHNVDHVLYSDFKQIDDKNMHAGNSLLGAIWNLLEDHRVEYLGDKEFEGDRMCNDAVGQEQLKHVIKAAKDPANKEQADAIMPLMRFNAEVQADYHPSNYSELPAMDSVMSTEAKPKLDKLLAGNFGDALRNVRKIEDPKEGTAATLALAKRIFKEVYEQDPEKEEQRCKQEKKQSKGAGNKAGEKGEPQKGQGDKPGDGDADKAEGGKAEGDSDKDGEGQCFNAFYDDVHSKDERKAKHDLTLDYSKYKSTQDYTPAVGNAFDVTDQTERPMSDGHRASSIQSALSHTSQGFAHRVRTLLQIRNRDRYQYGTKKGKLHGSMLHRITVPDAPGYSDRIFKKKIEANVLDAAVTLLVDQSGSMSGRRYDHAAAAAVMLSETIGNVLHVPVEILSFTDGGHAEDGGSKVKMYIHRKFDNKRVPQDVLVSRFGDSSRHMNNNPDGDAIVYSFDRLIKRKEPRKLLVVFSDGQPASCRRGDICWYTKKIIGEIETKSPVEIVGIGIQTNSVKEYYKENYIINDTQQLENALLSLIERKLT
jgi:cobalamin biosynthesis protein CobT